MSISEASVEDAALDWLLGLEWKVAHGRVGATSCGRTGGLVVDYLGLSHELKQALATYTESGGTGQTAVDKGEAIALMLEKHEVCVDMLHGFDFTAWATGTPAERLGLLPGGPGAHPRPGGRQGPLRRRSLRTR